MLLSTDFVDRLAQVLRDVEAVVDDLVGHPVHMLDRDFEVRFPHVYGHCPDALELLCRELLVIVLKALGLTILIHRRQCPTLTRTPQGPKSFVEDENLTGCPIIRTTSV